jgi:Ran GTPase-activating protein (RanGAP) involved in mRNA processing and transport
MMIEKHTSLTALHLNNNKLGDAGATSIGNALAHNSVLTDLQLNW